MAWVISITKHTTATACGILRSEDAGRAHGARPACVVLKPPGLMPAQNATRTPPFAVPVRLWSDIIMPSTALNTDTLRLVR
jgi:hypothetical protein